MTRRSLRQRSETFGLDTDQSWALPALRLLFSTPRVYAPLARAWDTRYPGTLQALERLTQSGFVDYQGPVIIDTRTGELRDRASRSVARYITTAKGRRLLADAAEDLRVLADHFPRLTDENTVALLRLLHAYCLEGSHARLGMSAQAATEASGLAGRTGRWWSARLLEQGFLRELETKAPDVREVVPAHWRITRGLCRQLSDVLAEFPEAPQHLAAEFRLRRSRFLPDIDPARVGINGATDYDHDVNAQHILAHLLRSTAALPDAVFALEPKYTLSLSAGRSPQSFQRDGERYIHYQPDAELRLRRDGTLTRAVVEYERYQSRRDAWSHLERFLGWLDATAMPFEPAELLFVVDSPARVRPYIELCDAFSEHLARHPHWRVPHKVTLAVTDTATLAKASDPLAWAHWRRVEVASADTDARPVLHDVDRSPYDEYFARDPRGTDTEGA